MTADSPYYLVMRRLTEDDGRTMVVKAFTTRKDAVSWVRKQEDSAVGPGEYEIVEPVKA